MYETFFYSIRLLKFLSVSFAQTGNTIRVATETASMTNAFSSILVGTLSGASELAEVGFFYGRTPELPSFTCDMIKKTQANGRFGIEVKGLLDNETYYYRAFAKVNDVYYYGEVDSLQTSTFTYTMDGQNYFEMIYVDGGTLMPSFSMMQTELLLNNDFTVENIVIPAANSNGDVALISAELYDFLHELTTQTGLSWRLPKSTEWKFAAKGGLHSAGYTYAGSNSIDEVAWYSGNSGNTPHPVAQKAPNELGLYDMSGNYAEIINDGTWLPHVDGAAYGGNWRSTAAQCTTSSYVSGNSSSSSYIQGTHIKELNACDARNVTCRLVYDRETQTTKATELIVFNTQITLLYGATEQIDICLVPSNVSTTLKYTSANNAVAKVSANGIVTGVLPGRTTISVSTLAGSNLTKTIEVVVESPTATITAWANDNTYGYVLGGGEYETGSMVTLTAVANKGYEFVRWSDGNTDNPRDVMATSDATYTAIFDRAQFIITYIVDGQILTTQAYSYQDIISPIEVPEKTGYTFSVWDGMPANGKMPAEKISVTATFTINTYTITYKIDDEIIGTQTYEYDTPITGLPVTPPIGYSFEGWYLPDRMPARDITMYGSYTINQYTITYIIDGKTVAVQTYDYNATITALAEPSKEGYTFSGWSDELPSTMPAHNVTVTGSYTINQYTITYVVDGQTVSTETYDYNATITALAEPSKEGYTFNGWSNVPNTMPANNITVTGSYTINQYTITYIIDGETVAIQTYDYNATVEGYITTEKEGYTFSGWSNELPSTMPAHNITVTGSYTINQYTITYIIDGETVAVQTYDYNATVEDYRATEKEGYTFSGWSNELPSTMPANNVTVRGSYTINQYTITYIIDGETVAVQTYDYNATVEGYRATEKEGYTFSGWSNELPSTMPAHNVTVTGSYTINQYTITYIIDGEVVNVQTYDYNATVEAYLATEKEGYTFSGWSDVPNTMPAHNITVTGSYTINQYTITYIIDGKTVAVQTYDYNATITALAEPSKEGYTFSGWSAELPSTMPAHNVTVTGSYTINQYTIAYIIDGETVAVQTYDYNATVEGYRATEREGYTFSGWSNELPSVMPAHNVTVTGSYTINQYTITTYAENGNVIGAGTYNYGTAVTLTATPNVGYKFAQWSDGNTDNPRAIIVTENATYTAKFTLQTFTISVLANDATLGSVTGSGEYTYGSNAVLIATPTVGCEFVSWSDGVTLSSRVVNVTENAQFVAQFKRKQFTITTMSNSEQMGVVVGEGTFDYGTQVVLQAVATQGYEFVQWNDSNTDNPRIITVTKNETYIAQFVASNFTVTVLSKDLSMGSVSGSGEYAYGSTVTLTATPNEGYEFVQWNDGVADNPRNMTVTEDATYIATFAPVTGLENSSTLQYRIYEINKTIYVEPAVNYSIYSNTGQDVTALNGHLETGIYIVKTENGSMKVMLK